MHCLAIPPFGHTAQEDDCSDWITVDAYQR